MKKRLMSLLLVCSMILSLFTGLSVTALAANSDFDIDGTELYQYTGTDTDVVIPDGITRIDEGAFAYNKFIESVTIPASVVTIAEGAFSGCENLTKVTFLGKCIDIDAFAFDGMDSMEVHCRAEDVDWYSYQGFSEDNIKGDVGGSTGTCAHENETEDVATPAGCTTPGSKVISCEDCGAELRTVTIPALGHLEKDEIITAATCETAGSKNVVCTRCSNTIKTNVEIKALGHNIVAGKCTREGCDYTEPAQEDLFQKFFESKTADMTAVNSTDKAWTALPSGLKYKLKASGSEEKVFTLTMEKGGYLTVKGTVSQPMAKVTAADANKKTVGTLSSTSYMPTTTAFEAQVKTGDVITFTYSSYAYADSSYYVEITDITLDTSCPHSLSQEIPAEAATCTKDGNNLYYECLVCKGKFKDKACTTPMSDAEAIISAGHTYDESKNVSVDGGKATVKTCTECKKTMVVAKTGGSGTAHTVTISATGAKAKWTANGVDKGTSYTVSSGGDFYFLAAADSGYVLTVTGATAVDSYNGEVAGYPALYKLANVTASTTVTLTTAAAPKAEYSFELRTENGTQVAYIKGYLGEGGDNGTITLPTSATVNGKDYPVVGVAEHAFNVLSGSVDGVKSGESLAKIKKIEAFAFCYVGKTGAYNLQEIVFQGADTVFAANSSSQNSQLSSNPNLTTVTLPANLTEIPSSLFSGDTKLDNVTIPKGVTKIGKGAFKSCTGLKTVTMKSGTAPTVEIGDRPNNNHPFAGCTVTVIVPKGAKAVYEKAWAAMMSAGKDKGGDITIQEQGGSVYFAQFEADDIAYNVISMSGSEYTAEVRKVKKTSGSKLNGASGTLTIPETVTITKADTDFTFTIIGIGEKALYEYENGYSSSDYWFAEVKFPSTLQYIGKWGCSGLAGVTEIDLSNTKVASIGSFAFNNCESLETIKLPATLTTFGGETKTETKANADQTGNDTNTGYVGGSESNKKFDGKQEESVCYTENVFMGCQSLQNILVAADNPSFKDVDGVLFTKDGKTLVRYPVGKPAASYTIPDGTEIIEECAFMQTATGMRLNPGKLQTVTFPGSLKQIKSGAFRQTSLTSVQLPANVTFGSYIFDCSKTLTTVTTEPGVTKIPDKAFWGCEKLTSVTLGDSVTAIGVSAFERTGLAGIDLNKVTDIGSYAFYGSKLTTVTVPAAAKSGTGAFMNCADLTTATVNGTKLDRYMFWYCTGLTTLNAPNVTEIDECALGYCVKLTSLPLAKVTSIDHGAFRNCHGLTAVTIPGSVRSFGKYVFADCGGLTSVTFVGNANVTSLPEGTFYECVELKEVHLGDHISQTEGLSFYMAGWNNGMKVDVYCNQPEEYFFRNEFDTCFIDLGNQQFDNEDRDPAAEDVVYIWTRTAEDDNGEKIYYFKAKSSGGCGGGGCGGGGATGADGMAEYFMKPSVTANFHYAAADQGAALANLAPARASALYSALPTVLTVEIKDKKTNQTVETYDYTLSDLESMAQTTPTGYQYVGMKGWAVMAATEYVTIDDLIGGEPLTGTDTITLYAGDGATYSATGADLQQNSYFFPASNSYTDRKVTSPATPVPAIIALEWNTGKIEVTPDSSALSAVAATAYKSTNLRFAHGLSAANYMALEDCSPDVSQSKEEVCSAMRMLQRVQKIVVTMDVQKDAQITVPAVISGTNAAVDSSKMSDALDKLADNGLLTIDAGASSSAGLRLTLPGADVKKLADKNAKLELITALGSVTLDAASLKGFGSSELVLTIEKLLRSTLSAALQNELDTHAAIYNVRATCGGAAVTSLSGKAQITLPYTLQTGEKAAAVRTSLLGSSTLSKLTAAYVSGSVSFETSVLATFAVDVPDKQNSVTITLTPVVKDSAASAALSASEAEEALAKLTEGGELILDARTTKTVASSEISIPRSVIRSMTEKKLSLQAVMNGAQVELDAAALTSAYGKLTGTNLRICAEQLANSDLPKAARSDFQTADLWRVWLTDGTREVTELTGSVRITLAYTLRKGQSAADMTAYAVNDNGTYTALRASNDKSAETLSFTGSRLGIFALTDLLDGELPFRDVDTSDWYYDDVRYVYENGLMNGVTTTQFAPKTDITRGMLVTILYRVEGEPAAPANPFKDVASGSYYEAAIAWAETRGIVNGFGGGLFRPNAPITREQFVAILYRYAAYKGLQTTASASLSAFADAASVSGWAVDAVRWAVGSGLMNGKNGRIDPAGLTTRAEAAALLHRYLA